jgi:alanine racemase
MLTLPSHRRAWIEIDLDAVVANAAALRSLLPGSTRLMAVVKADAYGHGAIPVALALERSGVDRFGVATLDEALALRDAGVRGRILVLYDIPAEAVTDARAASLELSAGSLDALRTLIGGAPSRPFVHLKIDSGMTRQGVRLAEIEPGAAELRHAAPWIAGIWTHLRDGADVESAAGQRAEFGRALDALAALGVRGERHVSASAAILSGGMADEEVVRPGLALYGAVPDEFAASGGSLPVSLRPAMAVRARPVRLVEVPAGTPVGYGGTFVTDAPSRLATLPVGYADGIARTLSNGRGSTLVRGQPVPIVGRISMDSLVVDVSHIPDAGREDVFTLLGSDGDEEISIEEMAAAAGTIPQEIGVRFNARLPRLYR